MYGKPLDPDLRARLYLGLLINRAWRRLASIKHVGLPQVALAIDIVSDEEHKLHDEVGTHIGFPRLTYGALAPIVDMFHATILMHYFENRHMEVR